MNILDFNQSIVAQVNPQKVSLGIDYVIYSAEGVPLGRFCEQLGSKFGRILKTIFSIDKYGSRTFQLIDNQNQVLVDVVKSKAYARPKFTLSNAGGYGAEIKTNMTKSKFDLSMNTGEQVTVLARGNGTYEAQSPQGLTYAQIGLGSGSIRINYTVNLDQVKYLSVMLAAFCIESALAHELVRKRGLIGSID